MLGKILGVVEDQEMSRAGEPVGDPLDIVRAPELLVAGCRSGPVFEDRRLVPLVVARRIAEAVEEIARACRGKRDAGRGVSGGERVPVVDHVEFALHRVHDDLVECLVVVERIAVQPIGLEAVPGQVDVQLVRVAGDRFPRAHVVRLCGVVILDHVIEEAPLPDDRAAGVHLDDRVHLGARGGRGRRVGPGGDQLRVGEVLVGNVERGVGFELRVVDPREIVVRVICGTGFEVGPHGRPVPAHLLESTEPAGVVGRGIQDVARAQQVRVCPDRPGMDDPPLHIQEIGFSADPEKRVAVVRPGRVPVLQLGRPLERIAGLPHSRHAQKNSSGDTDVFLRVHTAINLLVERRRNPSRAD